MYIFSNILHGGAFSACGCLQFKVASSSTCVRSGSSEPEKEIKMLVSVQCPYFTKEI